MKVRNILAAGVMVAGLSIAVSAPAAAAPGVAPDVTGLSESSARATLEAAGIDVTVATRNGSCALSEQVVHHQMDLSERTKIKSKYLGDGNWARTVITIPAKTYLNMVC